MASTQTHERTSELQNLESKYVVGQDARVHHALSRRTAENSAAFLIPHIKPTHKVLDVGCGPGSITVDFAELVPQGSCVGLDASVDALKTAAESAQERNLTNIEFIPGDAAKLPFEDNTFDIVYTHQVLVHAQTPIEVLREIRRVLKPGGFYGGREGDINDTLVTPNWLGLIEAYGLVGKLLALNGSNAGAGKVLGDWAIEAGFDASKIVKSSSWLSFGDREVNSDMWIPNTPGTIGTAIFDKGLASREQMEGYAKLWEKFRELPVGERDFKMKCGEVLCEK